MPVIEVDNFHGQLHFGGHFRETHRRNARHRSLCTTLVPRNSLRYSLATRGSGWLLAGHLIAVYQVKNLTVPDPCVSGGSGDASGVFCAALQAAAAG